MRVRAKLENKGKGTSWQCKVTGNHWVSLTTDRSKTNPIVTE